MRAERLQPSLIEALFAICTFAIGAAASIALGLVGVLASLVLVFGIGAVLGARPGTQRIPPGIIGVAVGIVGLVVVVPLAQEAQLGVGTTGEDVALVVSVAAFFIAGLLAPGALIGRGLSRNRMGLTALGCLIPLVLALIAAAIIASLPGMTGQ